MINVQIPLPDNVARDAEAAGLLTPRALAALIREGIRRKAAQRLIAGAKQAAGSGTQQISDADIADAVKEVRKDSRASNKRRTA